jgi:hypothetical protein
MTLGLRIFTDFWGDCLDSVEPQFVANVCLYFEEMAGGEKSSNNTCFLSPINSHLNPFTDFLDDGVYPISCWFWMKRHELKKRYCAVDFNTKLYTFTINN